VRVLVTGGTGFVGSHSVAALLRAGHEVRLLVRDSSRVERALGPLNVSDSDVVVGDIMDPEAIAKAVQGRDAVVHAAALFTFDPRRIANIDATNVRSTEVVLEAACKAGCDPVVHVSTFAAQVAPERGAQPGQPGWKHSHAVLAVEGGVRPGRAPLAGRGSPGRDHLSGRRNGAYVTRSRGWSLRVICPPKPPADLACPEAGPIQPRIREPGQPTPAPKANCYSVKTSRDAA
jgi:hypothetical protein